MRRQQTRLLAIAAVVLLASACSGSTEEDGIASLTDPDATASQAAQGTPEEQALAFAQCMRDKGVDFPDPTVDADGNPSFEGAFQRSQDEDGGFQPGNQDFRTAIEECGDLMEGLVLGGGRRGAGGGFDPAEIEEQLYAYTQCLRDEGLDVGDLFFGGGAGADGPPAEGAAGGPPRGEAGPGGDPVDRFAERLGQDPDSAEWVAANKVCQPVLDQAFAGAPE